MSEAHRHGASADKSVYVSVRLVLMSNCSEQEQIAKALVGSKEAQVATVALRGTSRVSAS